ncbi:hypothetical protein NC651_010560 [Populus alba x Populus x berolinensis]|nr:hypothetical protein NC651_010560 [Populus alba x Populus x berolinensis]
MVMLIRVGEFETSCFEGRNEEQEEFANGFTPLLGLSSSLCSAAEYLLQIVHGPLPQLFFDPNSSVPPAEITGSVLHLMISNAQFLLIPGRRALKLLNMSVRKQSKLIKPEFCEKSYELRQLMCRKLDVEHPALHSSLPLSNNKGFKHLPTDLCSVNLAGDYVFRGHISRYFRQDEQSKSKSVTPLVSSIISKGRGWRILAQGTFCPENPAITVCQSSRDKKRDSWKTLSLSRHFYLPPLNDEVLRQAIFAGENGPVSIVEQTIMPSVFDLVYLVH